MFQNNLLLYLSVGLAAIVVILLVVILISKRSKHDPQTSGTGSNKLATTLRDEKLKSSLILDAIEDGVVLVDEQQNVQLFNPGAANITGWSVSDAM